MRKIAKVLFLLIVTLSLAGCGKELNRCTQELINVLNQENVVNVTDYKNNSYEYSDDVNSFASMPITNFDKEVKDAEEALSDENLSLSKFTPCENLVVYVSIDKNSVFGVTMISNEDKVELKTSGNKEDFDRLNRIEQYMLETMWSVSELGNEQVLINEKADREIASDEREIKFEVESENGSKLYRLSASEYPNTNNDSVFLLPSVKDLTARDSFGEIDFVEGTDKGCASTFLFFYDQYGDEKMQIEWNRDETLKEDLFNYVGWSRIKGFNIADYNHFNANIGDYNVEVLTREYDNETEPNDFEAMFIIPAAKYITSLKTSVEYINITYFCENEWQAYCFINDYLSNDIEFIRTNNFESAVHKLSASSNNWFENRKNPSEIKHVDFNTIDWKVEEPDEKVILDESGKDIIGTIKALQEVAGIGIMDAKKLAEGTSMEVTTVKFTKVKDLIAILESVGAKAHYDEVRY